MFKHCALALCLAAASGLTMAAEPVDLAMINRIQHEAFHNSKVMDTMAELTEVIGPRLTGSPAMARAHAWTGQQMRDWGLTNVHDEAWDDFGRGWEFSFAHVDVLEPRAFPLRALPGSWTPGTDGPVEGEVMIVKIEKPEDLEQYKASWPARSCCSIRCVPMSGPSRSQPSDMTPTAWPACTSSPSPAMMPNGNSGRVNT